MFLGRIPILPVVLLSLGSAVALAIPNPLFTQSIAQNPVGQKQGVRGQPKLLDQLNLTNDQKQQLKAIHSQYKDKISQRQQTVRQANKELRDLMAGNASADQIRTKYKQVQGLRQELEDSRFESMLATREVMTPEQRTQFAQLMEQRRANNRKPMANQREAES